MTDIGKVITAGAVLLGAGLLFYLSKAKKMLALIVNFNDLKIHDFKNNYKTMVLTLVLNVRNPNSDPVKITKANINISHNGKAFAAVPGGNVIDFEVPGGNATKKLSLKIEVDLLPLAFSVVPDLLKGGDFAVEVNGYLYADGGDSFPVNATTTINLDEIKGVISNVKALFGK